jgi:hypothetical protein
MRLELPGPSTLAAFTFTFTSSAFAFTLTTTLTAMQDVRLLAGYHKAPPRARVVATTSDSRGAFSNLHPRHAPL